MELQAENPEVAQLTPVHVDTLAPAASMECFVIVHSKKESKEAEATEEESGTRTRRRALV